jgi:hypothetical protein
MSLYKNADYLSQSPSPEFDKIFTPGHATPHSGIYRCEGCGDEIASNVGNPLPAQNTRQHPPSAGAIRWRMIVYAQQK